MIPSQDTTREEFTWCKQAWLKLVCVPIYWHIIFPLSLTLPEKKETIVAGCMGLVSRSVTLCNQ